MIETICAAVLAKYDRPLTAEMFMGVRKQIERLAAGRMVSGIEFCGMRTEGTCGSVKLSPSVAAFDFRARVA